MIKTDFSKTGLRDKDFTVADLAEKVHEAHIKIRSTDGGVENAWVELPYSLSDGDIKAIKQKAEWIRKNCDVLLVIGIGGSYLGAYAGLRMLCGNNSFPVEFLGTSFDAVPVIKFLDKYGDKNICVNVISKSGTTKEISCVFEIINEFMHKKYHDRKDYRKRIIVTTDAVSGGLRKFADKNKLASFVVPDRVGGRYSVLSAVGLLPFSVAGISVDEILKGAKAAYDDLKNENNEAYKYAVTRYLLHTKYKKSVEVLASFCENTDGFAAWWQQLFGESEGKDGKGLFVSPMIFTRDLHSMGQYLQQGKKIVCETIINAEKPTTDSALNRLNRAAFLGTVKAHFSGGVPVTVLNIQGLDSRCFGYAVYFFEIACAMSAYLLGVNPFDQPGVQFYKKEMTESLTTEH
jgi:glucose-6-phosphate isomerase